VVQFGAPRVAQFLKLAGDPMRFQEAADILKAIKGSQKDEKVGSVFSRFLSYLRYCELKCESEPVPEMAWFV